MQNINKSKLILQFHITGRCNLNCKHCYRSEGDIEPLSYENIIGCIEQFIELKNIYNQRNGINKRGHINITGGEPFIRTDILDIISYLRNKNKDITFGILTNGSFIDSNIIKLIKESKVSFVQLSLDGTKEIHDELRTKGDYERVLHTAELLAKNNIRTYISFTANKKNYKCLPDVAKECRKRRITKLWSDRLVPIGCGEAISDLFIDSATIPQYIKSLKKARGGIFKRKLFSNTNIALERALQFDNYKDNIYSCGAGKKLIAVDEKGNIMPCRRLPIVCGNILHDQLKEVFYNDGIFKSLQTDSIPKECMQCDYALFCKGGAKCQAYARHKDINRADPACIYIS